MAFGFLSHVVTEQRELLVSHNGKNNNNCGFEIPCLTIGYTLEHRANANDVIKIDNRHSEYSKPFIVNKTFPFKENLTFIGSNGKPVISSKHSRVLFNDKGSVIKYTTVTLTVINLWFRRVALSQFTRAPHLTFIGIFKCQVSDLVSVNSSDRCLPFIYSKNPLNSNISSSIIVRMDDSNMFSFSRAVTFNGLNVILHITRSSFESRNYSSFAEMRNILSLKANFSAVSFLNVSLSVDLSENVQKPSVINITHSILTSNFLGIDVNSVTMNLWNCTVMTGITVKLANAFFEDCHFISNVIEYPLSGARFLGCVITLNRCTFMNNWRTIADPGVSPTGYSLKFNNCTFINNVHNPNSKKRPFGGGAINLFLGDAIFTGCHFINNGANKGGAVFADSTDPLFDNCHFENNTASELGGALYLNTVRYISIRECFFKENIAATRGSAVWYNGDMVPLRVINSVLSTSSYPGKHYNNIYTGAACIYSFYEVVLENVSIIDFDNFHLQSNLITTRTLKTKKNVSMQCLHGKSISIDGAFDNVNWGLTMVTVLCSACPQNTYSLSHGAVTFNETFNKAKGIGYSVKGIECLPCPFGGVCKNGQIHSANNFWGYSPNNLEVYFVACPYGYCCNAGRCKYYNSCAVGRHDILCSSCYKGLAENVFTSNCLEPNTCSHPWFWLVITFDGIFYFLALMYLKEIVLLFQLILLPKNLKYIFQRHIKSVPATETPLLTDDNQMQSSHDNTSVKDYKKSGSLFPGLFKIVVYFYQVSVLYKVPAVSRSSHNSFGLTKEILSTVFNLRADGLFYQNFLWCPFKSLKPVPKVLFKMSFILYLLFLVLLTHFVIQLWNLWKRVTVKSKSITPRLLPCGLRLILIGYATVTSALFCLLSCVPLHDSEKVLFIDGSTKCYQWWQIVITVIIILWVASFPVAMYMSPWLLNRRMISVRMFVVSLIFPCAAILYWLYIQICVSRKQSGYKIDNACPVSEEQDERNISQEELSQEILNVIEGPFRKSKSSANYRLPWESVLLTRRLVLIVIRTFVLNIAVRLYLMLLFSILFLAHQVRVQPFSGTILNYAESASLLMLVLICGINTVPAYNYSYPLSVSPFSNELTTAFFKIETALALLFPVTIVFCFTIMICIRICQLICWLCSTFVGVMHIYIKPKFF